MRNPHMADPELSPERLRRELGVFGATMMGLGAIIGTGVFVSIGVAAGVAGPAVILAIAIAALVAAANALNSAQLAASHPISGGTYEYGYKYLKPWLGFTAGWMFLCAKTASAATAALGFSGYLLNAFRASNRLLLIAVAVATAAILTLVVLGGMRQSNWTNIAIVSVTLLALSVFVLAGLPSALSSGAENLTPFFRSDAEGAMGAAQSVLHATALMFVAYTGYGRIATLGEEVHEPRRTIPKVIIITLLVSMLLYLAVGAVGLASVGPEVMRAATREKAAPLEVIARQFRVPGVHWLVAVGAMTAMLGVLLNLILGLSRVLLAMGRRGDMPAALAKLNASGRTPFWAVLAVGLAIAALALIGDVKTTWSFSAFTVLIYYAITNLAALYLLEQDRRYPRAVAWFGLAACLFLAFWVERRIWLVGVALIGLGLAWHLVASRAGRRA